MNIWIKKLCKIIIMEIYKPIILILWQLFLGFIAGILIGSVRNDMHHTKTSLFLSSKTSHHTWVEKYVRHSAMRELMVIMVVWGNKYRKLFVTGINMISLKIFIKKIWMALNCV